MLRAKIPFLMMLVVAVAAAYCPAEEIVHNYRWPATNAAAFWEGCNFGTAGLPNSTYMTLWQNMDPADPFITPDLKQMTLAEPNALYPRSAFFVGVDAAGVPTYDKGIRLANTYTFGSPPVTVITNTHWDMRAPFTFYGGIPDTTQTMNLDPNFGPVAPISLQNYNLSLRIENSATTGTRDRIHNFSDLKLQGLFGGWRPNGARIQGKMTLIGPTAFSCFRAAADYNWYIEAEVDATAVDEIKILNWSRERGGTISNASGNYMRTSSVWFYGTWIVESRLHVDRVGGMGEGDIQLNGGGTPGLMHILQAIPGTTPAVNVLVPQPWVDRRSGELRIMVKDGVSKNATLKIDTTRVLANPLTYAFRSWLGDPNEYTHPFTTANPQCLGGRVMMAAVASPVYVRELWVDGVQKANGTYLSSDPNNSLWFGTIAAAPGGSIIVTGATADRSVTMNALLNGVASAGLATYPPVGSTKAFMEGHALTIKAVSPISAAGNAYKFKNWTTDTGTGIADTAAAVTTVTVPTGGDIAVTANYVQTASAPSPANGATGVLTDVDLAWTPGSPTDAQELFFGTSIGSMTSVKTFPDGSTSGWTNAEIVAQIGGLIDTTTYYWRVNTGGDAGLLWQFTTEIRRVLLPISPLNGAIDVERIDPKLIWAAGHPSATKWDVYFGTNPDEPLTYYLTKQATDANDPNAPADLAVLTTYYWRVDEYSVHGSPIQGVQWNFKTRGPICLSIPKGDLDGDCYVTFVDFALVAKSFFNVSVSPLPYP